MNIIESIECCDLSTRNAGFREETCAAVIRGLKEIKENPYICGTVKEAFHTVRLAEQKYERLSWWCEAFTTYKNLWTAIQCKEVEPNLTDTDRSPNLRLLEALLFSIKITILAITTETECDDCCTESLGQLISMVNFVRSTMNSSSPRVHDP